MRHPFSYQRLAVAVLVGFVACGFLVLTKHFMPDGHTDFSALWNGARLMLHGQNPYEFIGPGRPYNYDYTLHYPASSLVAVMPLAGLSELGADLFFVFTSATLLAYGATKDNWNRLWIFPSAAFIIGARAGQFSPLVAAGYFMPWVATLLPLKPSTGLAVMGSWNERRAYYYGGGSALILLSVAFLMQPHWVTDWTSSTLSSGEYHSPVTWLGGFVLLLAVLRWRQREARLLLLLALIPQVSSWYEALLPMLVGRTKRECQILSLTSSFGYLLMIPLSMMREIPVSGVGSMMMAFAYLPALIVVLRRNED